MNYWYRSCLLVLLCFSCWSTATLQGQSPWSFGGQLIAGFSGKNETSYYESDPSDANQSYSLTTQRRQPLMGAGFWGGYNWGKHLTIRLGTEYIQARSFHTFETGRYNSLGVLSNFQERKWNVLLHQLQFPLQVEWYFGQRSWRPFIGFGIVPTWSLGGKFSSDFFVARPGSDDFFSTDGLNMDWSSDNNRAEAWSTPLQFSLGIELGRITLAIRHIAGQGFYYDALYTIPNNIIWEINPYYWIRETDVRRSTSIQILYQIL